MIDSKFLLAFLSFLFIYYYYFYCSCFELSFVNRGISELDLKHVPCMPLFIYQQVKERERNRVINIINMRKKKKNTIIGVSELRDNNVRVHKLVYTACKHHHKAQSQLTTSSLSHFTTNSRTSQCQVHILLMRNRHFSTSQINHRWSFIDGEQI